MSEESRKQELNDKDLEQVSGGSGGSEWQVGDWCEYYNFRTSFLTFGGVGHEVPDCACKVTNVFGRELELKAYVSKTVYRDPHQFSGPDGILKHHVESLGTALVPASEAKKIAAPWWAAGVSD